MTEKKLTLPIEIGRKYVRRDGVVVTAQERHPGIDSGCAYVGDGEPREKGTLHVYQETGRVWSDESSSRLDLVADYVEAPAVPDGFTPWGGGEQPAETRGRLVTVVLRGWPGVQDDPADTLRGSHIPNGSDIIAYKLADEQAAAVPAQIDGPSAVPHPHAASMLLYAQDATKTAKPWLLWECHRHDLPADSPWISLIGHPEWNPRVDYRRKPPTITVNGFEVQGGDVREPAVMAECCFANPANPAWFTAFFWRGEDHQREMLARGLVYLIRDRDACVARSKAMVGVQP